MKTTDRVRRSKMAASLVEWNGEYHSVTIHEERKVGKDDYWLITVEEEKEKVWVIKKTIKDLRAVIALQMKDFFDIPRLPAIRTKYGQWQYLLYRTENPSMRSLVSLDIHIGKEPTDDIIKQVKRLIGFKYIFRMDGRNDDFKVGMADRRAVVYSINETFPLDPTISEKVIKRWFGSNCRKDHPIPIKYITKMITDLRPMTPGKVATLNISPLVAGLDRLEEEMTEVVKRIDKSHIWYISDIVNGQLISTS